MRNYARIEKAVLFDVSSYKSGIKQAEDQCHDIAIWIHISITDSASRPMSLVGTVAQMSPLGNSVSTVVVFVFQIIKPALHNKSEVYPMKIGNIRLI